MRPLSFLFLLLLVAGGTAGGEDWPMYRHDPARSGWTAETLPFPLTELWNVGATAPPTPAWPVPQPGWAELPKLDFDHAHHAILVGNTLFFGSSVDHGIHAHDAATGARKWTFFTGAPVRLAPSWAEGKIYAGSDDGWVYCLDAASGRRIWAHRPFPNADHILGAGRVMSLWPVRTDVLVEGGIAYCAAGIFPTRETAVFAFDARSGQPFWRATAVPKELNVTLTPQGYLLADADQLFVLNGRTVPIRYRRSDGTVLGTLVRDYDIVKAKGVVSGGYGTLAEGRLFFGSQNILHTYDAEGKHQGAVRDARQIVVTSNRIYQLTGLPLPRTGEKGGRNTVLAFARTGGTDLLPSGTPLWRFTADRIQTLIVAGRHVVVGGDGEVTALEADSGRAIWSANVEGRALGLAAANGRLVVSTDTGRLHMFGRGARAAALPPLDLSPLLASAAPLRPLADGLVRDSGLSRGYVLLVGGNRMPLALLLSQRTGWTIHIAEPDAAKAEAARHALFSAGLYGGRIVVDDLSTWNPTNPLPYPPFFANLVVGQPELDGGEVLSPSLLFRYVKPCGGLFYLAGTSAPPREWSGEGEVHSVTLAGTHWLKLLRGRLPGSGDWTHQWADAGNTSCSGDRLMKGKPDVLWYGEPGPDKMPDRHRRNEAPLMLDGRVYAEGFRTADSMPILMCFDAYNGLMHWERPFPQAGRLDVMNDCGNLAVSSNGLFVAATDACHRLDLWNGQTRYVYRTPGGGEWAWVATVGDTLYGSEYEGYQFSRSVFAYDVETGRLKWRYGGGVIRNATLAVYDGRVYFVEHRGQKTAPRILRPLERIAAQAAERRGQTPAEENPADRTVEPRLRETAYIRTVTALDAETGQERWSRNEDLTDCGTWAGSLSLMAGNGAVVLCGTYSAYGKRTGEEPKRRALVLSAKDGTVLWNRPIGNLVRPLLIGDWLVSRPRSFQLKTGDPVMVPVGNRQKPWSIMPLGACGQMSASMFNLFYRYGVTVAMSVETGGSLMSFLGMRPGCLINIIPAGGVAVQVEASSGCTCYHALQATVVFIPAGFR